MEEIERWVKIIARRYDAKTGVVDEFPSRESARVAWKQALENSGYRYDREHKVWRKDGHCAVIPPH